MGFALCTAIDGSVCCAAPTKYSSSPIWVRCSATRPIVLNPVLEKMGVVAPYRKTATEEHLPKSTNSDGRMHDHRPNSAASPARAACCVWPIPCVGIVVFDGASSVRMSLVPAASDFLFCTYTSQEKPGKEAREDDMSLKKQMTKQDYPGAVAVIAIVHRPAAGDQSPSDATSPLPDYAGSSPSPTATADPPVTAQHLPHHHQQHGDQRPVFLHVANAGDCRGVLSRAGTAVVVTQDHTPSVPCEAARVEKAGGFVSRGRVNGILGVSRSFGDIHCKVCSEACCGRWCGEVYSLS